MNYFIPNNNINILIQEIMLLKEKISIIENRLKKIEKNKELSYLEKDDNYYMI